MPFKSDLGVYRQMIAIILEKYSGNQEKALPETEAI